MNLPIREQRKETNQQQKKAFHLVAAADFHEAPARSGDLNRGGEDLDAGLSWDRWKIREGEEDGGEWWSPALAMRPESEAERILEKGIPRRSRAVKVANATPPHDPRARPRGGAGR